MISKITQLNPHIDWSKPWNILNTVMAWFFDHLFMCFLRFVYSLPVFFITGFGFGKVCLCLFVSSWLFFASSLPFGTGFERIKLWKEKVVKRQILHPVPRKLFLTHTIFTQLCDTYFLSIHSVDRWHCCHVVVCK